MSPLSYHVLCINPTRSKNICGEPATKLVKQIKYHTGNRLSSPEYDYEEIGFGMTNEAEVKDGRKMKPAPKSI